MMQQLKQAGGESPSRRSILSSTTAASGSPLQESFGNAESIGGVAGDSSIGLSEEIGANHSTTGSGSLSSNYKRRNNNVSSSRRPGMSCYEDDSVMLWADDPERHYFEYMLQQEKEQRARQGKSAEDSLIGESTVESIQRHGTSQRYQNGGQESSENGTCNQTLDNASFPILSTYNTKGGGASLFGGFSLASTEKSNKPKAVVGGAASLFGGFSLASTEKSNKPRSKEGTKAEEPPVPVLVDNFFPSFIYVGGVGAETSSAAPGTCAKNCSEEVRHHMPRGRCFYCIVFLLGTICLAGTAVAVYLTIATKGRKKSSSSPNVSASSLQGNVAASIPIPPITQLNDVTWGPSTSTTVPTTAPSALLLQGQTHAPTMGETDGDTSAPSLHYSATIGNTAAPTIGLAGTTWPTTRAPSKGPTVAPVTGKPTTEQPTASPMITQGTTTLQPINVISRPSVVPSTTSTLSCGCYHCSADWENLADGFTCGDRITFLIFERGYSETGACRLVAGIEFPLECGFCDPHTCMGTVVSANEAPPSTMPSLRLANLDLEWKGGNGRPSSAFPLGRCEGDCDTDDDCGVGLVCYAREAFEAVPGCHDGEKDESRTDYCIPAWLASQVNDVGTSRNAGDDLFTP